MKTLLVYASRHGCTEKCAGLLAEKIAGEVVKFNLAKGKAPSPQGYDAVVVGGSIHAGRIQKTVAAYLEEHMAALLEKKVGLFLCCADFNRVEAQMKAAFPEPLYSQAAAREHLGFGLYFDKMNFLERALMKKILKTGENMETILHQNLERLAGVINCHG